MLLGIKQIGGGFGAPAAGGDCKWNAAIFFFFNTSKILDNWFGFVTFIAIGVVDWHLYLLIFFLWFFFTMKFIFYYNLTPICSVLKHHLQFFVLTLNCNLIFLFGTCFVFVLSFFCILFLFYNCFIYLSFVPNFLYTDCNWWYFHAWTMNLFLRKAKVWNQMLSFVFIFLVITHVNCLVGRISRLCRALKGNQISLNSLYLTFVYCYNDYDNK